jgi:F-type H+-transporting ATPase subunit c
MYPVIAEITGNIASAFGLLGAAIGVGLIGTKAAESVGRNPGASGKILVQAIIGMALAGPSPARRHFPLLPCCRSSLPSPTQPKPPPAPSRA